MAGHQICQIRDIVDGRWFGIKQSVCIKFIRCRIPVAAAPFKPTEVGRNLILSNPGAWAETFRPILVP